MEILGRDVTKGPPCATSTKNGRANGAPIHSKFHSAPPDPNGQVVTEPGSPGRALAQNEFRTQRRPLNVAFVLRRTVRNFEEAPALPGLPGSRLRERRSQQLVEELRVALAAARLHALAHQKADDLLVTVTILLRLIGTVCKAPRPRSAAARRHRSPDACHARRQSCWDRRRSGP